MDNIKYAYSKKRSAFGRACFFQMEKGAVTCSIPEDAELQNEFQPASFVNQSTEAGAAIGLSQANTVRKEYKEVGVNHVEGGWPRDVNPSDIESTSRYKKKIVRDEHYSPTVLRLAGLMEHVILQNNTVDIYRDHFGGSEVDDEQPVTATTVNTYQDPSTQPRTVSAISWQPDSGGSRIAVAYASLQFHAGPDSLAVPSYIWDVENPCEPESTLQPPDRLMSLQYSPQGGGLLAGGTERGVVCLFDPKTGASPVQTTTPEHSHRDPVYGTVWLCSESKTDLFTASSDGSVKWWDTRMLDEPVDTLVINPNNDATLNRAFGATALQYEPTMPDQFMVGTELGQVFSCRRHGASQAERITARFNAHLGVVRHVERNLAYPNSFLSVGDRCAKIWSEDRPDQPLCWTPNDMSAFNSGAWSPSRSSMFYIGKANGQLDVWDIIRRQKSPLLSLKVSDGSLETVKVYHTGRILATGCSRGVLTLFNVTGAESSGGHVTRQFWTRMLDMEADSQKSATKPLDTVSSTSSSTDPTLADVNRQQELERIREAHEQFFAGQQVEKARVERQRELLDSIGVQCELPEPATDEPDLTELTAPLPPSQTPQTDTNPSQRTPTEPATQSVSTAQYDR